MKDEKLENKFEEYFDGATAPDNITDGAKKYLKRRNAVWPKITKFASVAAGFAIVFAAALWIILSNPFAAPSAPVQPEIIIYNDEILSYSAADAYNIDGLDASLKFLKQLAHAENSAVTSCEVGYSENVPVLIKADVSALDGNSRHDAKVYVELNRSNYVYAELESYYDGAEYFYQGTEYRLLRTVAENGEPEYKLFFVYNEIKYYFDILSSDTNCYLKYLKSVIK